MTFGRVCCWQIVLLTVTCVAISCQELRDRTFLDIVHKTYFVDKSLLIEHLLSRSDDPMLISAPPFFGKTINIMMLHDFFQVPITQKGAILTKTESDSYNVFQRLKISNSSLFEKNFGSRGVIHYDFSMLAGFKSFPEFLKKFRWMFISSVRRSYFGLLYTFDWQTRRFLDEQCLNVSFPVSERAIRFCNVQLATKLKRFFGVTSLVLINKFSTLFEYALSPDGRRLPDADISNASNFLDKFMADLIKTHYGRIIWRAYLTGVLKVSNRYVNNLVCRSVFEDAELMQFYVFTEEDVREIGEKPKIELTERQKYDNAGGYRSYDRSKRGKTVFSPGFIVSEVRGLPPPWSGDAKYEFSKAMPLRNFPKLLAWHRLAMAVIESLKPSGVVIKNLKGLNLELLLTARAAEVSPDYKSSTYNKVMPLFFYYLTANGYYAARKKDSAYTLTVPNDSIWLIIQESIVTEKLFQKSLGCTKWAVENLRRSVRRLSERLESLKYLTESIAKLFMRRSDKDPNFTFYEHDYDKYDLTAPLYAFLVSGQKMISGMIYVPHPKDTKLVGKIDEVRTDYLDLFMYRRDGVPVLFETKHNNPGSSRKRSSAAEALQYIFQNNYTSHITERTYKFILLGIYTNETTCECSMSYNTYALEDSMYHHIRKNLSYVVSLADLRRRKK